MPAIPGVPDEVPPIRDIARLLRYGERFGTDKIDIRMLPLQLHAASGALAVFDPGAPKTWHVFDRSTGSGAFRVMLSIARPDGDAAGTVHAGAREKLAAVTIHVGRPPIARWAVAQFREPDRAMPTDALPRTATASGWLALLDAGDGPPGVLALPSETSVIEVPLTDGRRALAVPCEPGAFVAYWAIDAADKPVCVVIDFDVFPAKAWTAKPTT